jgi:hypothetical protein
MGHLTAIASNIAEARLRAMEARDKLSITALPDDARDLVS